MAEVVLVDLTSGLYRFIEASEPCLDERSLTQDAASRLAREARRLVSLVQDVRREVSDRLANTIDALARALGSIVTELTSVRPAPRRLRSEWQELGRHYEALLLDIKRRRIDLPADVRLEHVKPRNFARNIFHMVMGVVGILLYEFILTRTQTLALGGSILAFFVCLEALRFWSPRWNERLYGRVFSKISRPSEEHRICTSTWYMSGLLLVVLLLPKAAAELGTLVLAFGDPIASLAGKRWGKIKIVADKSLVGSLSFWLTATILCVAFLWWRQPLLGWWPALGIAAAVSLAGAVTELFSNRINDNLTIPLFAGATAMWLL